MFEVALSRITGKFFLFILFGVFYFMFSIIYSAAFGGVTKVDNGKFYAREKDTLDYYEIGFDEYYTRRNHQIRAISGGVLVFGLLGYATVLNQKYKHNKAVKWIQ
ncbi:hypothetical protein ABS311_00545 [Catenovulum sediminis]|uniref:Uncharacterized protein n=1 Tax=Catenovulum sediminis TaxID=1740262 RepID=A0ABV1RC68_9ALTE